ncbi:MAG: hypothetical protein ACRCWJ_15940 [Casimicrobium sp.]
MNAMLRMLVLLASLANVEPSFSQNFVYVEPGNASCPASSESNPVAPQTVQRGAFVTGRISVSCGFDKGSYTVTLSASDSNAEFSPKTFLVNFGSLAGDGVFTVRFASIGAQRISATITSNMGSPRAPGQFTSQTNEFNVVAP